MKFHFVFIFSATAIILVNCNPLDNHQVHKRSFSWLKWKKEEEKPVVPAALATGTFPVWKVHKYNGIELKPVPQGYAFPADIPADIPEPPVIVEKPLEEHEIRAINDLVAVIPDDQINTLDVRSLLPYTNLIPDAYLLQMQQALKAGVVKEKNKLKKIIDILKYIKELKLKPFKYIKHKIFGNEPPVPGQVVSVPAIPQPPVLPSYLNAHLVPEPPILPPVSIPARYDFPTKFIGNSYISVYPAKPELPMFRPAIPVGVNYQTSYIPVNQGLQTPAHTYLASNADIAIPDYAALPSTTNEQRVPFDSEPSNLTNDYQKPPVQNVLHHQQYEPNFQNPVEYDSQASNKEIFLANPEIEKPGKEAPSVAADLEYYRFPGQFNPTFALKQKSLVTSNSEGQDAGPISNNNFHNVKKSSSVPKYPEPFSRISSTPESGKQTDGVSDNNLKQQNFSEVEDLTYASFGDIQKVTQNNFPKTTVLKPAKHNMPIYVRPSPVQAQDASTDINAPSSTTEMEKTLIR